MQMDILKIADSPKKKPYFKLHKGSVQRVGSSRSQVKIGSFSSGAKSLIPVKSMCHFLHVFTFLYFLIYNVIDCTSVKFAKTKLYFLNFGRW